MIYPQEIIEELRLASDIVDIVSGYTVLKQKGGSYMGLCPFHGEKSPSFSVSADKQLYHCFGCGASGNVITFIMQIENLDFPDTVKFLADRVHYILPEPELSAEKQKQAKEKQVLYEIQKEAARFFYKNLTAEEGKTARAYLKLRNISGAAVKRFGLGFTPKGGSLFGYLRQKGYDTGLILKSGLAVKRESGETYDRFFNRLMFPIFDVSGKVIAFGGRILEKGEPKYLNSPETPIFSKNSQLYGLNYARASKENEILIVEGYMDVISLHQAGFTNAIASLGTAFTENHAKLLKKYTGNIVLLFDSDKAGVNAVLRAIPILLKNGLKVRVLQVSDAKDPDEYIKKFGSEAFRELLQSARSHIAFQIGLAMKKFDLENAEQKLQFIEEVSSMLAGINNAVEQDIYVSEAAKMANISREALLSEIKKLSDTESCKARPQNYKNKPSELSVSAKNVDEARRGILYFLLSDKAACESISKVLPPEEFVEPVYVKLCSMIYERRARDETPYAAELISFFDAVNEQQTVSQIFMNKTKFDSKSAAEKAINDQFRLIRTSYIEAQITKAADSNDFPWLQRLFELKNKVNKSYIVLADG